MMIARALCFASVFIAVTPVRASCIDQQVPLANADIVDAGEVVPTNFVSLMPPRFYVPFASSWWLRKVGQAELAPTSIDVGDDFIRVAPQVELEGDADYEALSFNTLDVPHASPGTTVDQSAQNIIAFHTASGAERDAPPAPVIRATQKREGYGGNYECGPVPSQTLAYVLVVSHGNAVTLSLRRDDDAVDSTSAAIDRTAVLLDRATVGGSHDYVVTAFNRAGQASDPAHVTIDLGWPGSCAAAPAAPAWLALALVCRRRSRR